MLGAGVGVEVLRDGANLPLLHDLGLVSALKCSCEFVFEARPKKVAGVVELEGKKDE